MIRKSDWDHVQETMSDEDRRTLGDPPTADDVLAYSRGDLSADDEARVRRLLVAYPELARAVAHPFPEIDEALPTNEIDAQWAKFRKRVDGGHGANVLQFWRAAAAIAASLAVVFGVLSWRARTELSQPRLASQEVLLLPDGHRGTGDPEATFPVTDEPVMLVVALAGDFQDHRLEIVHLNSSRPVWTSETFRRGDNNSVVVLVPGSFLNPGRYQVHLIGIDGARRERVATYSLRVV